MKKFIYLVVEEGFSVYFPTPMTTTIIKATEDLRKANRFKRKTQKKNQIDNMISKKCFDCYGVNNKNKDINGNYICKDYLKDENEIDSCSNYKDVEIYFRVRVRKIEVDNES